MDRVSRELAYGEPKTGYPLAAQFPVGAELIRAHARLTLYPTMGRLPVLRTDPTMTAAGYHSPESSVGGQSWSRDMSHGEAPLQVGSVAIVCEEQRKVKGVCLTSPLWKYGAGNRVSTRKMCALGGVRVRVLGVNVVQVWYRNAFQRAGVIAALRRRGQNSTTLPRSGARWRAMTSAWTPVT